MKVSKAEVIVLAAAVELGVSASAMLGKGRTRTVVRARDLAMLRIREELGLSYMEIGSLFKRDHSTVMAAVRRAERVEQEFATDGRSPTVGARLDALLGHTLMVKL